MVLWVFHGSVRYLLRIWCTLVPGTYLKRDIAADIEGTCQFCLERYTIFLLLKLCWIQCCVSGMFMPTGSGSDFSHSGSRIQGQKDPGSASRNLSIFDPKTISKLSEQWSGMFHPDPDFSHPGCWIRIPDPVVKKAPGPGYGYATLVECH